MGNKVLLVNPRKRKAKRKSPARKRRRNPAARKAVARRRSPARRSPAKRAPARRRRNPAARRGYKGLVDRQIIPAAIGASGALSLDVAMGYLGGYLPPSLSIGMTRHLVKGAAAIGIGMLAEMVVKKSTAAEMSKGALTVVLHDAMKEATEQYAPNVPLGEFVSGMGAYDGSGALGYTAAAAPVGNEYDMEMGEYVGDESAMY